MELKDLLAKVFGPKGSGDAMGRSARGAGSALASVLFMSHRIAPKDGPPTIFDMVATWNQPDSHDASMKQKK
jgi:hypothetical protein